MPAGSSPRFFALTEVAEVLSISVSQVYALVRRGDLPAIKIGGRGQWRVEASELEAYIAEAYASTRRFIADHPFIGDEPTEEPAEASSSEGEADAAEPATPTSRAPVSPR
ncbi:MAG: helix-turn-helix domain-containing protein [Nocardioidaceae bacterium]